MSDIQEVIRLEWKELCDMWAAECVALRAENDALKAAVKAAGPALEAAKDYVSTYGGFPLDGYAVMRRRDAAFAALKLALDPLTSADARRG